MPGLLLGGVAGAAGRAATTPYNSPAVVCAGSRPVAGRRACKAAKTSCDVTVNAGGILCCWRPQW